MTKPVQSEENPSEALKTVVRSIASKAQATNKDRAARLDEALVAAATGELDAEARLGATDMAHKLVGSAGTFGFRAASDLAAELEQFFADGGFDDPERLLAARHQLTDLHRELARDPVFDLDD